MSLRLNKIGNIAEVIPTTLGSGWCPLNGTTTAVMQRELPMWPFAANSIVGSKFRAYLHPNLSFSGAVANYAGQGSGSFRPDKGDTMLFGMLIDHLFDSDRADSTPILLGINTSIWCYVPSTQALPQLIPMVIWSNSAFSDEGDIIATVNAYSIIPPSFDNRLIAGKMMTFSSVDKSVAIEKRGFDHVYFAWSIGRPLPQDVAGEYKLDAIGLSASFNSLKGNRPVFDPIMV